MNDNQFNQFLNGNGGFLCYNPKRNINIDKKNEILSINRQSLNSQRIQFICHR